MSENTDKLDEFIPKQTRPKMKDRGWAVVLGGDFETGKTYFIGSCLDPIVIIDMDQGTEAMWDQYDHVKQEEYKGLFPDKDIRVMEIRVDSELENSTLDEDMDLDFDTGFVNAFINAREAVKTVTKALQAGAKIGTVAFETASWLWAGAMDYMKYKVLELDPTAKSYVEQMFDWFVAQKEYSKVFKQMIALRDYGCNVIITVHTKPVYVMKKVEGRSTRVKVGEEFQWWDKSFRMSPIVLKITKEDVEFETGRWRKTRVTEFERIRGVPNAAALAKPIYDITYDKFIQELSDIRLRYEEIKTSGDDPEDATYNKIDSVKDEEKQERRGRRRDRGRDTVKPTSTEKSKPESKKESEEEVKVEVPEDGTPRRRRRRS